MKSIEEIKSLRTAHAKDQETAIEKRAQAWIEANSPEIEKSIVEFGAFRCFVKQTAVNPADPKAMLLKEINKIIDHFQTLGYKTSCKDYTAGIWDFWIFLGP
jgi:hypothetical protein